MTREILDELDEIQDKLYRIRNTVSRISREVKFRNRDDFRF